MDVVYSTKRLAERCADYNAMRREWGNEVAKKLGVQLAALEALDKLEDVFALPGRWERLTGNRIGQLSARLSKNWRLIVKPGQAAEGAEPEVVVIVEVVDYH